MADVYLSFSDVDRELASALEARLFELGLSVWNPFTNALPGAHFEDATARELNLAECVVVIVSPESAQSEWVKREVEVAVTTGKRIIPVVVGDVELPMSLRRFQAAYVDDEQLQAVAERIRQTIQPTRAKASTPT